MIRYILKPVLAILLFATAQNAHTQKVVSEANAQVRQVEAFTSISVGGALNVIITQGSQPTVVVAASDVKLRDKIFTRVEDGTLHLGMSGNHFNTNGRQWMRVYIAVPDLKKIGAGGASDVLIEGIFKAANLEIALSGASDFRGHIEGDRLKLAASGSSDIDIKGKADRVEVALSGASDLNGRGLVARVCEIGASGSSDAQISITEQIKASASGSCDIIYYGNPKVKDHAATRGASITQKN